MCHKCRDCHSDITPGLEAWVYGISYHWKCRPRSPRDLLNTRGKSHK